MTIGQPDFILYLGGIGFQDFEIPPEIKAGLEQAMFVHKYPGGARTVDTMGPDYLPISWGGVFLDGEATQRAQALQAMAKAGVPVLLTFGAFKYTVDIQKFEYRFQRYYQLPYTIELTVISDDASPLVNASQSVTGATATQGENSVAAPTEEVMQQDNADCQFDADQTGNAGLIAATGAVGAAVSAIDSISSATLAQLQGIATLTATAAGVANALTQAYDGAVVAAGAVENFASGTDPVAFMATLNGLATSSLAINYSQDCANKATRLNRSVLSLMQA